MKTKLLICISCSAMISSIAFADTTYQTDGRFSAAYSSDHATSHQYSSAASQRDRTMRHPGNATGTGTRTNELDLNNPGNTDTQYPEDNDYETNEPNLRDQKPGKPEMPQ